MIEFGAVLGSPDSYHVDGKATKISWFFRDNKPNEISATINLVFHYPWEKQPLDYEGIRTGIFSKKEKMLMIQAAAPVEIIEETDDKVVWNYLIEILLSSVELAKVTFSKKGINYLCEEDLQIIQDLKSKLPLNNYEDRTEKNIKSFWESKKLVDEVAKELGL